MRLRDDRLEWREVEGEVVLVDLAGGVYISINRTGAVLWPLLVEGTTREQLTSRLEEHFGLSSEDAARDVDAFVGDLERQGLLVR